MRFRKLHGSGNDFILITSPSDRAADWPEVARRLCARRTGIGADGLVISNPLTATVLQVVCYNADGSEATMCGNALRCVAWCAARDQHLTQLSMVMAGVVHHAQIHDDGVWVTANVGAVESDRVKVEVYGSVLRFDAAHTGTEHVVAIVPDLESIDVESIGRRVRSHPDLAPLGSNVNFVQPCGRGELHIRTYERGVEAETLSCGSGAVAAAVIARHRGLISAGDIVVHNRSGTPLTVRPHPHSHTTAFWVGGPVTCLFQGELL